jgi:hypothetical protein
MLPTEQVAAEAAVWNSYMGRVGFESRMGHGLSCLGGVVYISPSRKIPIEYLN